MKNLIRMVLTLTVICAGAGALLAWVNEKTAGPIEETERAVKLDAIKKVLPACDNDPGADVIELTHAEADWTFHVARQGATFVGAAFEVSSMKGYGGLIRVMVGVTADGKLNAIKILEQKETPGLGAKIESDEFRGQFAGRSIADTNWAVKKDKGDVVEITAATISSRAVTEAIKQGLDVFVANQPVIAAGQE